MPGYAAIAFYSLSYSAHRKLMPFSRSSELGSVNRSILNFIFYSYFPRILLDNIARKCELYFNEEIYPYQRAAETAA